LFFTLARSGIFFFSLRAPISSFLAGQITVLSFQADLVFRCLPELKIHPTPAEFCLIVIRAGCSVDFSSKSASPGQICLSFDFCVAVLLVSLFLPSKKYSFSSLPRTGSHQVDLLGLISKKPHQPLISFSLASISHEASQRRSDLCLCIQLLRVIVLALPAVVAVQAEVPHAC
jgi:hypothetical protein